MDFIDALARIKEFARTSDGSAMSVIRIAGGSTSDEEHFLCELANSPQLFKVVLWAQSGFLGGSYYFESRATRLVLVITEPSLNVRLGHRLSEVENVLQAFLTRDDICLQFASDALARNQFSEMPLAQLPAFFSSLPTRDLDTGSLRNFFELLQG